MAPGDSNRLLAAPELGDSYRFELGGGHWIFGGDPLVIRLLDSVAPLRTHTRRSAVYLHDRNLFIPYPIQNNLRCLGPDLAAQALAEMVGTSTRTEHTGTLAEWLRASFGPTLCSLFFDDFHKLYTAGLWKTASPQDGYKSPLDMASVIRGAFGPIPDEGYNSRFVYPRDGLNVLCDRLAAKCNIRYQKTVLRISTKEKMLYMSDGSCVDYAGLISTLPLNHTLQISDVRTESPQDPYTSVLVLNVGGIRGDACPHYHWVYTPSSRSGFHRVGIYSNVDPSFLQVSSRSGPDRVSMYVERAYRGGDRPSPDQLRSVSASVTEELLEWGWIRQVEVADPTWVDVAYTWRWPGSRWREEALTMLEARGIFPVGRFARWRFQGIADSVRDGLMAGAAIGK